MNQTAAPDANYPADAILEEVARALRNPDAVLTNIESAIATTQYSLQQVRVCFGGTRGLMLAMVECLSHAMAASLDPGSPDQSIRQRLIQYAQRILELQTASPVRGLYRIAVTEGIRRSAAANYLEVFKAQLTQPLADFLRRAQSEGAIGSTDPNTLAGHFLASLWPNLCDGESLSRQLAQSHAARRAHAQNVVDLFCRGVSGGHRGETH